MTITNQVLDPVLLAAYMDRAHEAGCPIDQTQRFIHAGYAALPNMMPFHIAARQVTPGRREIALDGTRGSAKSHATIAQVALDDCQAHPGLKFLFLRQTAKAAGESFDDLVNKVLMGIKHEHNTEKVTFPNGSRIVVGGFHDEGDIAKYIGIEYDGLVLEEATQIPGDRYEQLAGSVRTSRQDWIPRIYLTFNPGGVGHQYYKDRFIQPSRNNNETTTFRFFSSYKDNPFLDLGYRLYLEGLTGDLAKKWRDGDWDVFEGQAFSQWRYDRHVIQPKVLPDSWVRWRAIDWGLTAPFCCYWYARDPDNGRIYVYRELYKAGLNDRQQARAILDMTPPDESIPFTFADPAMWGKKSVENIITTTADTYAANGVPLTKADNDRLSGKRKVDRALDDLPDGRPGLIVFSTCPNMIRTLPALSHDKIKLEDVDTDGEDHAYDNLRYALTQVREYRPVTTNVRPYTNPFNKQTRRNL